MEWNFFQPKKKKKITLFFSLPARPCSHRPCARGRKDILATYFFAEELFVSLISVKFAIRLSLLQPSFRVLFYSFSGASLLFEFRRVGEDPGNEVVFTVESNIKPSCNRVTNLVKYYPILQKTAIGQWPQTNNSDLMTIKSLCVCAFVENINRYVSPLT